MRNDTRWMPFVQSRFRVIHNGVPPIDFIDRGRGRSELAPGFDPEFWIGSIAELHPTKQLSVAIEAFARIAPQFPNAGLVLIGEGEEQERLAVQIHALGLDDRVLLVGHVPQAARYLTAFDLFILPSRSEGLGYVVLEAGLAGLPVIASRVGGIPEILIDEKYGRLVAAGDTAAFAEAFTQFIGNETLRKEAGAALCERVRTEFSLEQMVRKTLALY